MQQTVIQIITALFGSLGFALMFNLGKRNVIPAAVNGMCTWIVYIIVRNIIDDVFVPSLAASLWAAIYAEIAARIMKAPANQYLIVGLIPLLPGAPLYYTLGAAFDSDWATAGAYGNDTILFVLGIAVGISVVCGFDDIIKKLRQKTQENHRKDELECPDR